MPSSGRSSSSASPPLMALPVRDPRRDLRERVRPEGHPERASTPRRSTSSNGIPAIVIGIFVFGLIVVGHGQSALCGRLRARRAHAAARRPLDDRGARARAELAARGGARRSASPRWRTTLGIVLPQTIGGIAHRGDARGRARRGRDRAAALHLVARRHAGRSWNPRHAARRAFPSRSSSCPSRPIPPTTRAPGRLRSC